MNIAKRVVLHMALVVFLVIPLSDGFAWSRTGHMVIAAMAYRSLPAHIQESYTEILKHHPDFQKWKREYDSLNVDIELGEYLFMQASYWPDVIRRSGGEYNNPTWHYTNFPLTPAVLSGRDTKIQETLTPENDIIHGFKESRKILFDSSLSKEKRAAHMSWILHLVGDAHQPLHCVALVTDMFPEGDRGGNSFYVRPGEESAGINLHAFWDQLLGDSDDIRDARNETTRLLHTANAAQHEQRNRPINFRRWILEGRDVAIEYVYLNGALPSTEKDDRAEAAVLPENYARNAKSIAEERAILAGIRLATVLKSGI